MPTPEPDRRALADMIERCVVKVPGKPLSRPLLYDWQWLQIVAALRTPDKPEGFREGIEAAAKVCHKEQMTVWSGEVVGRLSLGDYLRDDLSYDDVLAIHSAVADEVRRIVENAFSHPELASTSDEESAR